MSLSTEPSRGRSHRFPYWLALLKRYEKVRRLTESICQPLEIDDYSAQPHPDVSPPKWHLGHTTWFFEAMVLKQFIPHYQPYDSQYFYLFNSYYKSMGNHQLRHQRGHLTRPPVEKVYQYRAHVDEQIRLVLKNGPKNHLDGDAFQKILKIIEVGIQHEQQHQELLLMDIKFIFFSNPLRPVYRLPEPHVDSVYSPQGWHNFSPGLREIGYHGKSFSYDHEGPVHQVFIHDYRLSTRLVTNGEYMEFMNAGGYQNPLYWLSDGWDTVQSENWKAPLYWEFIDGEWLVMTLAGMQEIDENEPVSHISFYEADAYARWAGKRLATEFEWEHAASLVEISGNFMENEIYHPQCNSIATLSLLHRSDPKQMFGDLWEWTSSAFLPYHGYRAEDGVLSEYNGKFMCNQKVLRGGSCVTPRTHIRHTYRNFFYPHQRWMFSGVRLAEDL